MTIRVRVPATSANLGPGFDSLGVTLDLWNELEVEKEGVTLQISVEGEGHQEIARDKNNAIYRAMLTYAQRHHKTLPNGLILRCKNRIPISSGLGSSAAAAVAGIKAAAEILGFAQDLDGQLECATLLEGHPDNVAPCLMGGLVAAIVEEQQVIARNLPITQLPLMVAVPDFHFSTRASRANLPHEISRKDAVYNLGRLALLTHALASGDLDLLARAMQDKIHQPFRLPVIPGAQEALTAAQNEGAAAVALSGAGPSLLIFLRDENQFERVSTAVRQAFSHAGLESRIFSPKISQTGASMEII